MIELFPTVVPSSRADVEAAIARYAPFAAYLHVDFADGVFAPNTTWLPQAGERIAGMPWEAHVMVEHPREIGLACIAAGASRVIGHVEASGEQSSEIFKAWRGAGAKEAGLALLSQTPLEALEPYLSDCDLVMLMTITAIGVQGLPFDEKGPERVASLRAEHPALIIAVDGGVNENTLPLLAAAGATRFCAGSVLSSSPEPASTYRRLLALGGGVE